MSTPRLISALFKAAPAFALGLVLIAASANIHQKVLIAQAAESDNTGVIASATGRSFHPPGNAKRRSGYITTTGSNNLLASRTSSFRPPSNPRRRSDRYDTTNGVRGGSCPGTAQTAFTTLGPDKTVGLTASTRPKFVWYLPPSDIAYPVTFRLLALDANDDPTPIYTQELTYTSGFMAYQLPPEVADLSPGKGYLWQVVVQCDPDHPSKWLAQALSFEVALPSASLLRSLDTATTDADRALAYGQAGYWYDAIAQVAQPDSPQAKAVRQSLLEDLANMATDNEQIKKDILHITEVAD